MSIPVPITMSPEEMIFTFKQGSEEIFKEAWSRVFDSYSKAEPRITLSQHVIYLYGETPLVNL